MFPHADRHHLKEINIKNEQNADALFDYFIILLFRLR